MLAFAVMATLAQATKTVALNTLDLEGIEQGWGYPQRNKSVEGNPLTIGGKVYPTGIGTHAESRWVIQLGGKATKFTATVGLDDETKGKGSIEFILKCDDKKVWASGIMKPGTPAKFVNIPLAKVQRLSLLVTDAGDGSDYDHADWIAPTVTSHAAVIPFTFPVEKPYILTPEAAPVPRLTGPQIFGVRPNRPILHRFTATGQKPMKFTAEGLPQGVKVDDITGQLSGTLPLNGSFDLTVHAANGVGSTSRKFKLVCGDTIALTPPMGWNSWYCYYDAVTQKNVEKAATQMVSSGLADHGWTYINIDDGWEMKPGSTDPLLSGDMRDKDGLINSNGKFPDMKGLTDHIHGLGLKAGLYSSPGPTTCAGFHATYQCEDKDVQRWSQWGFDLIKYDWCSYGEIVKNPTLDEFKKPYQDLRAALNKSNRDIFFSLCQYGMGDVWNWGAEVDGNMWRTTGDITDHWSSISSIGFAQDKMAPHAQPGHWNDPDMLQVGNFVQGNGTLRKTRLTPSEQYTQVTLWSLLAAPFLTSCDLGSLDAFSKNLLMNDDVIEVDQDVMGKAAHLVAKAGMGQVWARPLSDGSFAIGLFNLGDDVAPVELRLSELGFNEAKLVKDIWRQKKVATKAFKVGARLPRHGVAFFRVWPA